MDPPRLAKPKGPGLFPSVGSDGQPADTAPEEFNHPSPKVEHWSDRAGEMHDDFQHILEIALYLQSLGFLILLDHKPGLRRVEPTLKCIRYSCQAARFPFYKLQIYCHSTSSYHHFEIPQNITSEPEIPLQTYHQKIHFHIHVHPFSRPKQPPQGNYPLVMTFTVCELEAMAESKFLEFSH